MTYTPQIRPLFLFIATLFLFAGSGSVSGESRGVVPNGTGSANLRPLEFFGIAFQRIRTAYVDSVDDNIVLKNAILGVAESSPVMKEHPATKKALRSLEEGTQDLKGKLEVFGEFLVAARSVTNKPLDRLTAAAIQGMLKGLDPRSSYVTPAEMRYLQLQNSSSIGGLGLELKMEDGIPKVIAPVEDAPAERAGVLTGDYITHLDGASLGGLMLAEAVEKMRGPVGSTVLLTIRRKGFPNSIELKISRDIVRIYPVRYSLEADVGLIKIKTLQSPYTYEYLKQAIDGLKKTAHSELKGYIIDLRGNSGGLMDQAVKVAGAFAERGAVVLEQGRVAIEKNTSSGGDLTEGKPVVVLINGNTASGAEVVAISLQDEHRATIVGRRSFGAGTVQTLIPLDGEGAVRLTTYRLLRANGQSWDGKGVEPDVVVDVASEPPAKDRSDPDLAAALDILRRPH